MSSVVELESRRFVISVRVLGSFQCQFGCPDSVLVDMVVVLGPILAMFGSAKRVNPGMICISACNQ